MPISVYHTKTSLLPDSGDAALVQPSDWNADHGISGLPAYGASLVDFGNAPGTSIASANVIGQTDILDGSTVHAFFDAGDSTPSHTAYEHMVAPLAIVLACGAVISGTGFTINALSNYRISGAFNVRWAWSN